jgi:hypothetical protein
MEEKPQPSVGLLAEAEKILNQTLAYQAASAVHGLKNRLNLDVKELRLMVAPARLDEPGSYRVVCTIVSLAIAEPVVVEVVVLPDKAIVRPARAPAGDTAAPGGPAKP